MSAEESLCLHYVHVRRTPGIDDPFLLDDFVPGVNLVYGPNASGKTSTARAIEAVLWPAADATHRLSVSARYSIGQSEFVVALDAGHLGVQRNGAESRPPELPAPEFRQRYKLSLHELLLATDRTDQFADEIARQSAGGYDFTAAADALGFLSKPSTAASEGRALEAARKDLKEAQDDQAALHRDASGLEELEARSKAASCAGAQEQVLAKAIDYAHKIAVLDQTRARFAKYPAVLQHVHGDEIEKLEQLDARLDTASKTEMEEAERVAAAVEAAALALPGGPIAPQAVLVLKETAMALADAERCVAVCERRVQEVCARLEAARRAIGGTPTNEKLEAIDGDSFGDLADFALRADQLQAAYAAAEAEERLAAEGEEGRPAVKLDVVNNGMRLLVQWLSEADPQQTGAERPSSDLLMWVLACLAGVGSLAAAVTWHPVAGVGLLLALAIAVLLHRQKPVADSARPRRERDYAALGIEPPRSWSTAHVIEALDRLEQLAADIRVADRRAQWAEDARRKRQGLDDKRSVLDRDRVALAQRLGVAPDADAHRLSWIGQHVSHWFDAFQELRGAEAERVSARAQLARAQTNTVCAAAAVRLSAPAHAAEALGLAASVEQCVQKHDAAVQRQKDAVHRQREAAAARVHNQAAIDAVFDSCECDRGNMDALKAFCADRSSYVETFEAVRLAEHDCDSAQHVLESDGLYEPTLATTDVIELNGKRAAAAALASEHERLMTKSTRLRALVDQAKQQCEVEPALARQATAEEALRTARRRDLDALIGGALVKHVQRATRDHQRPRVFHRSRELFSAITRGRYQLEFEEPEVGGDAGFRALDTRTRRGHALDELSSATRVQLLLAVRIAFVESQENGVKLPLLFDETLGNSDDHRAAAIIDAVITLAEGGRQVFYFTAQRDELAKWMSALDARAASHTVLDLAARRDLHGALPIDLSVGPVATPTIAALPLPCEHTHDSYGTALHVPAVRSRERQCGRDALVVFD